MKYILDFDALLFTVTLGLYICTMEVAENLNTYSSSQTVRSLDTQKITQKTYMELFISKLRTLLVKIVVVFVEYGIIHFKTTPVYFSLSMKKYYLYQET